MAFVTSRSMAGGFGSGKNLDRAALWLVVDGVSMGI
jgi:hypothetical protein